MTNTETIIATESKGKVLKGTVVASKMLDSCTVAVEYFVMHPKYKKFMRRTKKFLVHDKGNTAVVGQLVEIKETRPISKRKRFELVILSVQTAEPRKQVKKKDVLCAVVVRQKKAFRRKDGSYVSFDDNAVVIVDKVKKEPKANRVFGPIPRELAEAGFQKIVSLAPEVV